MTLIRKVYPRGPCPLHACRPLPVWRGDDMSTLHCCVDTKQTEDITHGKYGHACFCAISQLLPVNYCKFHRRPGSRAVHNVYLDPTSRTIPHLAAPFSDTAPGHTTEAVTADEDNDYSLNISRKAGLNFISCMRSVTLLQTATA
ncbi:hypothetical protein E3U43_003901 [Larimichthys crocea]|uniref:Uncharacterized protein n=1 Tax=Larimichthys crocea TaxID=215358 RepID=A0ACD3RJN0_LARCR|nr:hypothetical protein E3U43_003901 [Larimichthys crocea]